MTLYWWTHWFWITIFMLLYIQDNIRFVGTYPLNAPYGNKDYSKDKPLKFPLAAQTDVDDVFTTDEMIFSGIFRNSKVIRQKTEILENGGDSSSSKDNIVMPPLASALGEIPSDQQQQQHDHQMKLHNDTITDSANRMDDKINRTKADVNLANSSSNSSLVRTNSPSEDASSVALATDTAEHLPNPVITNINNNHSNITNDNDSSSSSDSNKNAESQAESNRNSNNSLTIVASPLLSSSLDTTVDNENDNSNPFLHKSFHFENITKAEEIIRAEIARQLDGERGRKSKVLAEYRQELKFNFTADTKNLLARSAAISLEDFHQDQDDNDDGNISSEALSIQRAYILDAGAISGICFAVVGLFSGVALAGIMLYRRRYLNKPQALSEPDSSGYIDDSTIRDNSDEMYSLDNDSFLNSLEAMTIQNYWTDTVKHTKL